jgi:hypothetical protein
MSSSNSADDEASKNASMKSMPPTTNDDRISFLPPSTIDGNNDTADASLRGAVGDGMHVFTDLINDHLVAARFGVFAGVGLLTAYGLSNTPLFSRFRTVSEVPGKAN